MKYSLKDSMSAVDLRFSLRQVELALARIEGKKLKVSLRELFRVYAHVEAHSIPLFLKQSEA